MRFEAYSFGSIRIDGVTYEHNVIAKPSTTVGFVGAELTVDPEYGRQKSECAKAAAKMFQGIAKTKPKVKFGDPSSLSQVFSAICQLKLD